MPSLTRRKRWGTGRRDYSINIEEAVVPVARSHQYRLYYHFEYDLTSYSFMTIDTEPIYGQIALAGVPAKPSGYNTLLYSADITFNDNILIKAYFGLIDTVTYTTDYKQLKYGYGSVRFIFPRGLSLTDIESSISQDTRAWCLAFLPGGYKIRSTFSLLSEELVR